MKDQKKKRGKSAIIDDLMAKGFSARKATRAVNAVIDAWKFALYCGEEVEAPGLRDLADQIAAIVRRLQV